jgi:hypothetical protein
MRQRDSIVAYRLLDSTCNSQRIHEQLVHLIDLDMLAAEGSPLDLEEIRVYLMAQDLRGSSKSQIHTCSSSENLTTIATSQNNFTR